MKRTITFCWGSSVVNKLLSKEKRNKKFSSSDITKLGNFSVKTAFDC